MMKQHFNMPQGLIGLTHLVEDQNNSLNYHQSDYPRMTYLLEDSLEEDSLEEEYQEEVENTQEAEAHLEEDPLEEDGDLHQSKYHNHNPEN